MTQQCLYLLYREQSYHVLLAYPFVMFVLWNYLYLWQS